MQRGGGAAGAAGGRPGAHRCRRGDLIAEGDKDARKHAAPRAQADDVAVSAVGMEVAVGARGLRQGGLLSQPDHEADVRVTHPQPLRLREDPPEARAYAVHDVWNGRGYKS